MMRIGFEGVTQTAGGLERLKSAVQKRVLRRAITAGNKVIKPVLKAGVPRDEGDLRKSIGDKVLTYRRMVKVVGMVGPRADYIRVGKRSKRTKRPARYYHLADRGHKSLAKAIASTRGRVMGTIATVVEDGIKREASRAAG